MASKHIRLLWGDERAGALRRLSVLRWQVEVAAGLLLLGLLLGLPLAVRSGLAWRQQARAAQALGDQAQALAGRLARSTVARSKLDSFMLANDRSLAALIAKQPAPAATALVPGAPAKLGQRGSADEAWAAGADADGEVALLWTRARKQQADLARLVDYWHHAEKRLQHTPAIRPVQVAWLSSSFGVRIDPISGALLMHKGLDLAGQLGMQVMAPADGVVIWAGTRGGYGQTVVIDHGWGLQTHFAHLSKYIVRLGDTVVRRQVVAEMGSTGKSTGPHLHYEVRLDGYPIDPRKFILD